MSFSPEQSPPRHVHVDVGEYDAEIIEKLSQTVVIFHAPNEPATVEGYIDQPDTEE